MTRWLLLALASWVALVVSPPALAQQHGCEVESVSVMDFGRPGSNPTSAVQTTAELSIRCEGNGSERNSSIQVCVGVEPVTNRALRWLYLFPALRYEIYRDPGHSQTWGYSGARRSTTVVLDGGTPGRPSGTTSISLYGQLQSGQTALPAGPYWAPFAGDVRSSTNLGANCDQLPLQDTFSSSAVATLEGSCEVNVEDLSFGKVSSLDSDVTAASSITVQCSRDTRYRVFADGGAVSGNVNARAMAPVGGGADRIAYELRHTSAAEPIWGNGSGGTNALIGVGTGLPETTSILARVPGGQNTPPAGRYEDVVTITVEY